MSDALRSTFAQKRQALIEQARRVDSGFGELTRARDQAKQAEASLAQFITQFAQLAKETSAAVHDIVLARSGDEWSLALAGVANYCVGNLSWARLSQDRALEDGMVLNLSRLSDALGKAFPDRKTAIEPWRRAVAAFGTPAEPAVISKPHPQVDSLSRMVRVLRDTGPNLLFRELFAPSEAGLHIVRPA